MQIIAHSEPDSKGYLIQVTYRGHERLYYKGAQVNDNLFTIDEPAQLKAVTLDNVYEYKFDDKIFSLAEKSKLERENAKELGLQLLEDEEGDSRLFGSPENLAKHREFCAKFSVTSRAVEKLGELTITYNVAKNLHPHVIPLRNVEGILEVGKYSYNRAGHASAGMKEIAQLITDHGMSLLENYDFSKEFIQYFKSGNQKLRIELEKYGTFVGSEAQVLAEIAMTDKRTLKQKAIVVGAAGDSAKVVVNFYDELRSIRQTLATVGVKQKYSRSFSNSLTKFDEVLEKIATKIVK